MCDHVCETKCRRSTVDEPLSIKYLKRYITDHASRPSVKRMPVTRREKLAIVGAGPSGLTAARDLISRGYAVTVFEGLPDPGGMLRWGIPAYRLPREILAREIRDIIDMGVELRCNTWVGRDVGWETLKKNVDGIYLAMGAQKSASMGVDGEELAGVGGAVEFLRAHNLGKHPEVGSRVAVIGGGNCAIDAARCVLRLGAEAVMIIYRRRRSDMPAQKEEIRAAEAEGITIHDLATPVRLEGRNGRVGRIVCQRMVLGEFGSDGRRKPVAQAGAEFVLEVDQVIVAIGQQPDFSAAFPIVRCSIDPKWLYRSESGRPYGRSHDFCRRRCRQGAGFGRSCHCGRSSGRSGHGPDHSGKKWRTGLPAVTGRPHRHPHDRCRRDPRDTESPYAGARCQPKIQDV